MIIVPIILLVVVGRVTERRLSGETAFDLSEAFLPRYPKSRTPARTCLQQFFLTAVVQCGSHLVATLRWAVFKERRDRLGDETSGATHLRGWKVSGTEQSTSGEDPMAVLHWSLSSKPYSKTALAQTIGRRVLASIGRSSSLVRRIDCGQKGSVRAESAWGHYQTSSTRFLRRLPRHEFEIRSVVRAGDACFGSCGDCSPTGISILAVDEIGNQSLTTQLDPVDGVAEVPVRQVDLRGTKTDHGRVGGSSGNSRYATVSGKKERRGGGHERQTWLPDACWCAAGKRGSISRCRGPTKFGIGP